MAKMSVSLWVAEDCNMRCRYCYEGDKNAAFMKESTAIEVYKFLRSTFAINGVQECLVRFHGGEPLLNYKVISLLIDKFNTIEGIRFTYSITTNGTLYGRNILNLLRKIDDISISIDGKPLVHNSMRIFKNGIGSYSTVSSNIKKMIKDGLKITGRVTVSLDSVCVLFENIMHLWDLGFKHIFCYIDYWNYYWTKADLSIYSIQIKKCEEYIKDKNEYSICSSISITDSDKGVCLGGIYNRVIDYEGNIYPCIAVHGNNKFIIGSIFTGIDLDWEKRLEEFNRNVSEECIDCKNNLRCIARRCVFFRYAFDNKKLIYNLCNLQKFLDD